MVFTELLRTSWMCGGCNELRPIVSVSQTTESLPRSVTSTVGVAVRGGRTSYPYSKDGSDVGGSRSTKLGARSSGESYLSVKVGP